MFRYGLSILFALFGTAAGAIDIWVPRPHNAAFVEPGGTFVAEVKGASNLIFAGWAAQLNNDLNVWPCTVISAVYSTIHHNTEPGWLITIAVPQDIPPELMNLTLAHSAQGSDTAQRAVSVVSNFETDFYILHTSDQHIIGYDAIQPNGGAHPDYGNGSTESMGWAAPVVNLINPRFIIYTGDNLQIYHEATSWVGLTEGRRRCRIYLEALAQYNVPTLVTTGNHDIGYSDYVSVQQWKDAYEEEIGQRSFSFYMGSFYVLANEWTSNEFLNWAKGDYASAFGNPGIRYGLIAQHYYDGPTGWTTVPGASNPCSLTIVGHNHAVRTLQTSPYLVYSDGAGQDYQRSGFYDLRRVPAGWSCVQNSSHVNNVDVFRLFGDWGVPGKVRATVQKANDGTQNSNTVTIVNDLPQNFYNGRFRFHMAKGRYKLSGPNAIIEAMYDYDSGSKTAVLAKINIAKNASVSVSITHAFGPDELAGIVESWLMVDCQLTGSCYGADLSSDGKIDLADFEILSRQWL